MIGRGPHNGILAIPKTHTRKGVPFRRPQACGCRSTYVAKQCISALLPSHLPFTRRACGFAASPDFPPAAKDI